MQRTVSDSLQRLCVFYRNPQNSCILHDWIKEIKFWKSNSVLHLIVSIRHKTVVLKLSRTSAWSGGLSEIQTDEPHPQSYDSVGLLGPENLHLKQAPGNADVWSWDPTLRNMDFKVSYASKAEEKHFLFLFLSPWFLFSNLNFLCLRLI